uniref:Uncharacterized protein n=1 Tax=Pithovirus LCPAC401 TaxID=2506595 RepID=A0A481Z924_9VIRU|nr:MAG: uncharacterized protein LCPAC401_00320 [Pithovirus LCPAC401]
MSISEEKFDILEINESEERLFIINKISLTTDPENWPEDSMPRLMYEGDRNAPEYVINNPKMNRKSIELIKSVVIREKKGPVLNLIDTDWNNIELTVRYLGIGVGVDFLYPLFLVSDDRIMWYDECKDRISHVCQYRSEDDGNLLEMNLDDVVTTNSSYITMNNLNLHPKKLKRLRQSEEKEEEITNIGKDMSDLIDEIVQTLSNVPDLLIVRDVALARFRGIKSLIKLVRGTGRSLNTIDEIINMDVFAYGPDALEHIIDAVRLCLELSKKNFREYQRRNHRSEEITFMDVKEILTPYRTRHQIVIPMKSIEVEFGIVLDVSFPLVKLHSKRDILTKIPLDCFAIGFDPKDPNTFYGLPRTYRSLDTMTNVVDPTRNGIMYLQILNIVSMIGFDIAIPGFNIDDIGKLPCSDKILKILNLIRSVALYKKEIIQLRRGVNFRRSYARGISINQIREKIEKTKEKLSYMKLSGLVLLLAKIIHGTVSSYHRNRYSEFELAMEHHLTHRFRLTSVDSRLKRGEVIFGDILNQGEREFRITSTHRSPTRNITEDITYIPLFPKIELLSFNLPTALYQVKTAFYSQYTCVEDIYVPDDVSREDEDVYELLNILSQRTL